MHYKGTGLRMIIIIIIIIIIRQYLKYLQQIAEADQKRKIGSISHVGGAIVALAAAFGITSGGTDHKDHFFV